jgi:hypothetical protein
LSTENELTELFEVPRATTEAQGEFEPITELSALVPAPLRWFEPEQVSLETTGVTSQLLQAELIATQLIFKASICAKLKEIGAMDIAEPLLDCHTQQGYAQCNGCRKVKPFWNHCDNFYCPVCQPHLARERADSIEWWTKLVEQPKHIVLTARNTDAITFNRVRWFKSCLAKLRRSKLARGWRGGMWSLEVTNEGKGWHLHAHLLVDASWVDGAALSIKWGELVGQEFAIVWVADARKKNYLRELTKYAVKGSQLASWSGLDIAHFVNAFKGNRTFGVFGSLYGKRTQWREWIKSIASDRRKCDCGCSNWSFYSETEWAIHERRQAALSGKLGNPPPRRTSQLHQVEFLQPLAMP